MLIDDRKNDVVSVHKSGVLNNRVNLILVHIIGSLAFLMIPVLSPPPGTNNLFESLGDYHHLKDIFGFGLTLLFFYANYYYFIPNTYFKKRYTLYILWCMIGFAFITILPNLVFPDTNFMHGRGHHRPLPPDMGKPGGFIFMYGHMIHNVLRFLVVLSISMMLKTNSRLKQIQKEKMDAEISFLKAQINPHFLFNTLNSIYSLALTKSDYAAPAVVKLSSLMRYSISESDKDKVPFSKELAYISNYIELQRMRLSSKVRIFHTVNGDGTGKDIVPFLLIPFIENAFKHGVNAEEDSLIDVKIDITTERLVLNVRNNKVYVQPDREDSTGLGIGNTRERLKHLYPGKHNLVILDGDDYFNVLLELYW